jgi:hypothetical protein
MAISVSSFEQRRLSSSNSTLTRPKSDFRQSKTLEAASFIVRPESLRVFIIYVSTVVQGCAIEMSNRSLSKRYCEVKVLVVNVGQSEALL